MRNPRHGTRKTSLRCLHGRVISLAKRLLDNRHLCRADSTERKRKRPSLEQESGASPMDIDSPNEQGPSVASSPVPPQEQGKTSAIKLASPQPLDRFGDARCPCQLSDGHEAAARHFNRWLLTKHRSPDLRVQMPPPLFSGSPTSIASATTPLSAGGLLAQSPSSVGFPLTPFPLTPNGNTAANPSPVKKKRSLSDYKDRMKAKPSVDSKSATNADDPKSASSDVVKAESPTAEKVPDTIPSTNGPL